MATLDVAMNAEASAVEQALGRPIMSSLHGMFSIGGMAGAAVGRRAARARHGARRASCAGVGREPGRAARLDARRAAARAASRGAREGVVVESLALGRAVGARRRRADRADRRRRHVRLGDRLYARRRARHARRCRARPTRRSPAAWRRAASAATAVRARFGAPQLDLRQRGARVRRHGHGARAAEHDRHDDRLHADGPRPREHDAGAVRGGGARRRA